MRRTAILFAFLLSGCAAHDPAAVETGPELGALVTARHVVRVTQAADGPRYTIETRDGETVAVELTWDELRAELPTLAEKLEGATAAGRLDASR